MTATPWSAESLLRLGADHLWQSTLIVVIAATLCVMLRKNGGHLRYVVFLAASAKFLVPFAALTAVGAALPWPASVPAEAPVVATIRSLGQPFVARSAEAIVDVQVPSAGPATAASSRAPQLILAIWILGSLGFGAHHLHGAWRLFRLRRLSRPLTAGRELESVRRVAATTARAAVPVYASRQVGSPCVAGIVRPVMLWPDGVASTLSDDQLDAVARHELAHVGRRHNLGGAVQSAVETLFWFHPLVWWLGARLSAERERACDEDVLAAGVRPADYASAILHVCEQSLGVRPVGATGIASSTLTRRLEAIMSSHTPQPPGWFTRAALLTCTFALFAGPLAAGAINAQGPTGGTVAGVVTDERGGTLPDVTVSARSADGVTRSVRTDESGRYRVAGTAGEQELRFERAGFRPRVVRVDLRADAAATLDVQLRVGGVTESITLTAAPDDALSRSAGDSETALLERIAGRPDDVESHLALAELYYRDERFAESETTMARAATLYGIRQDARSPATPTAATGDLDPPKMVRTVTPIYPASARTAGVTGVVIVEATIAEDGTVQNAVVRRSVTGLDDAAVGAVRQWLYTPVRLNGVPVAVAMTATLTFAKD
jgi:TonB family protein